MDATDGILLLIAGLLAVGIWVFIRESKQRTRDTEMMRAALYAVAQLRTRDGNPLPVTFDSSVNKALRRFQQTAIDLQGMIELGARWAVLNMPPDALEDMRVPENWTRITRQGVK